MVLIGIIIVYLYVLPFSNSYTILDQDYWPEPISQTSLDLHYKFQSQDMAAPTHGDSTATEFNNINSPKTQNSKTFSSVLLELSKGPQRCGTIDDEMYPSSIDTDLYSAPGQPANYVLSGEKYGSKLTWSLTKPHPSLSLIEQRQTITKAFKYWSDAAAIEIEETSGKADILISFEKFDHGDKYSFDGEGGVLAHAFYPRDGRVHFDLDEKWSIGKSEGANFEMIATHEFGHSIGIKHSKNRNSVMAPVYQGYKRHFKLHDDDIQAVQYLYGVPHQKVSSIGLPPITLSARVFGPSRISMPNVCKMKFDDITRLADGRYYVFKQSWIFRLNKYHNAVESGWPKRVKDVYQSFPSNPDAVVYSHHTYRLYVFKGGRIWRYYKDTLDSGFSTYPRISDDLKLENVRNAFHSRNGTIYLMTKRELFRFDERSLSIVKLGSIRDYFQDAPYGSGAAVFDGLKFLYLFRGSRYYKLDIDTGTMIGSGYPQSTHRHWISRLCRSKRKFL